MRTDVLVVGSGPAGLSTALSVKHEAPELEVIVVDALPSRPPGSGAMILFPGTMEALRTVAAHHPIDHHGYHSEAHTFFYRDELALKANYSALSSQTVFPYLVLMSQELTEELLTKQAKEAGVKILRGYKATKLEDMEKGLTIAFEDGQNISADYVVGADGSQSTMRELAEISFYEPDFFGRLTLIDPRESNKGGPTLIVADVTLQSDEHIPCHLMTAFHSAGFGVLAPIAFTLPSSNQGSEPQETVHRVVFPVGKGDISRARDPSDNAYIRDYVAKHYTFLGGTKLSGGGYGSKSIIVKEVLYRSTFPVRLGMTPTMHKFYPTSRGNLVLVGDAAHVHPPTGGQGMNLGIRDAVAAGKAIAAYHRSGRRETRTLELFKDFDAKRQAETMKVVRMTKILFHFWTTQNPVGKLIRWSTLFCASFISWIGVLVAHRMSGLAN